jgi:hypothetical protein
VPDPVPADGGPTVQVRAAPVGAKGFDTATALTDHAARAFAAAGFVFAVRYVSRFVPGPAGDLTAAEAQAILASGLALMAVQHCEMEGWAPSAARGARYGEAAAANAKAAGLPQGINLWLDLEGVASGTAASVVAAYCNAWYQAVAAHGYLPGLYFGVGQVLTGEQLYKDLPFQYYWKPDSKYVPDVAVRGQCMAQAIGSGFVLDGVAYDRDVTMADAGGHTPVWAVAAL